MSDGAESELSKCPIIQIVYSTHKIRDFYTGNHEMVQLIKSIRQENRHLESFSTTL